MEGVQLGLGKSKNRTKCSSQLSFSDELWALYAKKICEKD